MIETFFKEAYGKNHIVTDHRHLLWQFKNPFTKNLSIRFIKKNRRILAALGHIPVKLSLGGKMVKSAWLANWIVRPENRGQGLGSSLLKGANYAPILLASGFSAMAYSLYLRYGWSKLGFYKRLIYIGKKKKSRMIWNEPFPYREWDKAWQEIKKGYDATTDRSSGYIKWRYLKHPFIKYHIGLMRDKGKIVGLAVIRIEKIARIIDFVASPSYERMVIQELFKWPVIDVYLTLDRLIRKFIKAGFKKETKKSTIPELFNPVVKPAHKKRPILLKTVYPSVFKLKWHLVKGDGDRDRAY